MVAAEHRLNSANQNVTIDIGTLATGQKIRMVMTFFKNNEGIITSTDHLDDVDLALIKERWP